MMHGRSTGHSVLREGNYTRNEDARQEMGIPDDVRASREIAGCCRVLTISCLV
jgi:SLT domain-containing protein